MAKILIVDDKPGVRQVFAEGLAFEGYTVFISRNPVSIRQVVHCSQPDLVIIDPFIGGKHRWDLLEEIKQLDPHVPVLIVTSLESYRDDPHLSLAAGILIKSFYFDDLLKKVAEMIGRIHPANDFPLLTVQG